MGAPPCRGCFLRKAASSLNCSPPRGDSSLGGLKDTSKGWMRPACFANHCQPHERPLQWRRLHIGASRVVCTATHPQVVVTREQGKNGGLIAALEGKGIRVLELPLIEATSGPDRERLPHTLQTDSFDWITITSPEAAAVFLEGWHAAGKPAVRVAVVGKGTGDVFAAAAAGLEPAFTPSVANAASLSAEIPTVEGGNMRVLYPASVKASTDLQDGLAARGFQVLRLNTYNTLPVTQVDETKLRQAQQADVVAVASPSAIKAWVKLAGNEAAAKVAVACIGSTSAKAAQNLSLSDVYFPDKPGLDGFVESITEALDSRLALSSV